MIHNVLLCEKIAKGQFLNNEDAIRFKTRSILNLLKIQKYLVFNPAFDSSFVFDYATELKRMKIHKI